MLVSLLDLWSVMPFLAPDDSGGGGGGEDDGGQGRDDQDGDSGTTNEDGDTGDAGREGREAGGEDDDAPLGEAGTKALRKERQMRRKAEQELAKLRGKGGGDDADDESGEDASDLAQELERTRQELREARAEAAIIRAVEATGVAEPAAVAVLAMSHIRFDKSGNPTNVKAALKATREEYPGLFTAGGSADGGAGGAGSNSPRDINTVLRDQIRKQRRGG